MHAILDKDDKGNSANGDAILTDSENCYVHADSRLVATLGISDISIIETTDCVLVAHNDHAQNTKKIAEFLKSSGRTEADTHTAIPVVVTRFDV